MQDFTDEMPPLNGLPMSEIVALYSHWSIVDLIAAAHVVTEDDDYYKWTATRGHSIERGEIVYTYLSGDRRPTNMSADDFREDVSEQLYTLRVMNKDIAQIVAPE